MALVAPGRYIRLRWWHMRKTLCGIRRHRRIALPEPGMLFKLYADITDDDRCQRGPDGVPLGKLTPFVRFTTAREFSQ